MGKNMDRQEVPAHVAIIMDGNGRWAKKRLLTRSAGHNAGAQNLRKLAVDAEKLGIKYLTVYAFSTENWKRDKSEVDGLMNLLRQYIQQYIDDTKKNDMRVSVIGELSRLDPDLQEKIAYLIELTKSKTGLHLVIALNYGGRDEILRAVKKVCVAASRGMDTAGMTEDDFARYLDTAGFPDPDLLIRTSGEMRASNFLPWQTAYTELYFSEKYWPDFKADDLREAIAHYQQRDRRFGGRR